MGLVEHLAGLIPDLVCLMVGVVSTHTRPLHRLLIR